MAKSETSYQEGQSGNPGGRPKKGWTWADVVKKAMEQVDGEGENAKPVKQVIAEALVREAKLGNVPAIKEIGDRVDGKATQKIQMTDGEADRLLAELRKSLDNDKSIPTISDKQRADVAESQSTDNI